MKIIIKIIAGITILWLVITCILLFIYGGEAECQTQPYQKSTTAKYIDTTHYDTTSCPGLSGVKRTGIITNESYSINLIVYFSKRDSSVRDTNTYTIIQPRAKVRFSFYGNKIFRIAASDSVFSQVIFGDDIDISISGLSIAITSLPAITLTPKIDTLIIIDTLKAGDSVNTHNLRGYDIFILYAEADTSAGTYLDSIKLSTLTAAGNIYSIGAKRLYGNIDDTVIVSNVSGIAYLIFNPYPETLRLRMINAIYFSTRIWIYEIHAIRKR